MLSPAFRQRVTQILTVRPSHLPNSSIKGDGVRVFSSGRDRPYRQDFHAPTKLLPQTIQNSGRAGMPATWSDDFQRSHHHGINANVIREWLPTYRDQSPATLPALVPVKAVPRRATEEMVIISLPLGDNSITVKWPASDPDGWASFIRSVAQ